MGPIGVEPIDNPEATWDIDINTEEIRNLRQRYTISDDDFARVVETAANIMSNFPNPQGTPREATGLALGKVQSGKTLSFTTLIALASSNQYKIIVVLAGTKKTLLKQTQDRLEKDLGLLQTEIAHNILIYPNPLMRDLYSIRSVLDTGRCALIVCMKNRSRIRHVIRLLSSQELLNRSPVLIIDDEGDEASLNTQYRNGEESSTYRSIRELRDSIPKHAYVAYTATPQANLLLQQIDTLSPDFCVLVEPGEGYCGGSTFFGENIDQYIGAIPNEQVEIIDNGGMPESLQEALAIFYVGAAIRHIRKPGDIHSMLIHTSSRMEDHATIMRSLTGMHENWRDRIRLNDTDPIKQALIRRFHSAYEDLVEAINNPPTWDAILQKLDFELRSTQIWIFNSSEIRAGIEPRFQLENNIVIGGNMLGRGVTIKNLTVTYITRRAEGETNADTMEQRARWFGYKKEYLDLCRVYMTNQLRHDYIDLLQHEDDFWESLRRHIRQGIPVTEWPRFFRLDSAGLRPTRANVASFEQFRPHGWERMQPTIDISLANSNLTFINDFFSSRDLEPLLIGNITHQIFKNCPIPEVVNELISKITPGSNWDPGYMSEYLLRLFVSNRLRNIDVVIMRGDNDGFRLRSPNDGQINMMQGSNRSPGDPLYYPGDSNIHNNMPQLQVHKILYVDGDTRVRTCALALYIPEIEAFNMSFVVRADD